MHKHSVIIVITSSSGYCITNSLVTDRSPGAAVWEITVCRVCDWHLREKYAYRILQGHVLKNGHLRNKSMRRDENIDMHLLGYKKKQTPGL
jgi:hypothetical protein